MFSTNTPGEPRAKQSLFDFNGARSLSFIILVLTLSTLLTKADPFIPFTAKLTDTNRLIVDGKRALTFRLYSTKDGGTQLWTETQNLSVVQGVVSVTLGSVSSLSSLSLESDLWLGISVGDDAEMAPRIRVPSQRFGVPRGTIVMWTGNTANIPSGWALCNGTQGTPDLSGRFVVAAGTNSSTGSIYLPMQSGGSEGHDHGGSTQPHKLTIDEMPSHQHSAWGETFDGFWPWGTAGGKSNPGSGSTDRDNYFYLTSPTGGDQAHSHGIPPASNLPPFYALAFIMRL